MVKEVAFESIEVGKYPNAREHLGDIAELRKSIQHSGLLAPLQVVQRRAKGGTVYDLVAGFRRLQAITGLDMDKVPVIVVDKSQAAEINIAENVQRKNLTYAEVVIGVMRLISGGMSQKEAAAALGMTQAWASQRARIGKLMDTDIWPHVLSGEIPSDLALELAGMDADAAKATASGVLDISFDDDAAAEDDAPPPDEKGKKKEATPKKGASVVPRSSSKAAADDKKAPPKKAKTGQAKRAAVAKIVGKVKFAVGAKAVKVLLDAAQGEKLGLSEAENTLTIDICGWLLGESDLPFEVPE